MVDSEEGCCPGPLSPGTYSKRANLGKRLFRRFRTVVRLRRIHRQPGASDYKESLIRLRDGAMTKEDWELWRQHDLAAGPACKLTRAERHRLEDEAKKVRAHRGRSTSVSKHHFCLHAPR